MSPFPVRDRMSARMATTSAIILILPSGDAGITTPRAYARLRRPVTANSRPTMMATIQAVASSSCTSEISAAVINSLSASGSMTCPNAVTCFRRRARYPSSQSVSDARPKMAAPTISFGTPRIRRPSNFVSSTTTSSGTRKMRVTVSEFGKFIVARDHVQHAFHMISSVVAMKAILLAGGKGTRLRPLTIHTPKPIVPIFDRPFLHYQLDRLKQVPEIDEVILSLNYQPRRIEEIFGDGGDSGLGIRYVVEPAPLGTAGARGH